MSHANTLVCMLFFFLLIPARAESAVSLGLLSASPGTREAAFVYALSAATISHTIARACTSGDLRLCSCGPIPAQMLEPGYRWGGCADNLHYGLIMGSKFADAPMKMKRAGSHANKLMHLHNSEVGRQVSAKFYESKMQSFLCNGVQMLFILLEYYSILYLPPCFHVQVLREALVMKCKCHGVSGSCSIRTCWKGLQDLREIALDLKTKYLSATKVVHRPMGTRKQLVPKDIDIRPVRENELVYLQSSPDFCTKNEKQGSVGTQDRWDCHVMLLCLSLHEKEEGVWQQEQFFLLDCWTYQTQTHSADK